ncbi:glycosyl transferase family 1 [Mycobacterium sp. 852002-51163_SCH5372311]|uniref:glycosyltransferase n=1 Tax=Mycobacterium sp. 852002-51163_SCH5372311 TaxID=1834097 RepID=UPI0007FD8495|nr:glycosyl transferase family 1 [Mycobacterium sp. 852002-51163_SCH5372311]
MTTDMCRTYAEPGGPAQTMNTTLSHRPLAVLIVTYKSHDLVEQCLASVAEQLPGLPVYVYENSGDTYPGRQVLAARHPDVHWVLGPVNLGFAAAFNALVKHTPPDTDLLMMNADSRLRGPLTRTRELLQQPGVAAVSPTMRDAAAPRRVTWDVARRRTKLIRALVAASGYSDRLRGTPVSQLYARQPTESQEIDGYIAGACLAINRAAWDSVGVFDEEFFLYGEDVDWQTRARAAGWRVVLADELAVDHGNPLPDVCNISKGPDSVHGGEVSADERRRNRDLLRANTALMLERQTTVHHADIYLAGTTLLDRVQRSKRIARAEARAKQRTELPAIVITTNRLVYGGAERQKSLLATELVRRGYPVTIACVQRFGPLIKEIPHNVRVVRQPWWAPHVDLPPGPAVVISGDTNTETGFATVWRASGAHRRWLVAPHTHPDMPIYSRPLVSAMNRADGFVMLAQRHWDMLAEHHRLTRRHFVAPNGVVVPGPPGAPRARTAGDPLHLVMLSRIEEFKNPHLLIEALAGLAELPWKLSVFGDGPDREELEARTPEGLRDRVHWRGWSDGPGPALADADLLCMPSRCETFPLVILEAMARAIPVVSSAVCAVPEMLDFGAAGFLVEDISVAGWRERLAEILAAPDALPSTGRLGFERMSKHYTVEAMADAYIDAINEVL